MAAVEEPRGTDRPHRPSHPDRLASAARRLSAASRLLAGLTALLWRGGLLAVVVLVGLAGYALFSRFGGAILGSDSREPQVRYVEAPRVVAAAEPIPWEKVDAAVAQAAARARQRACRHACDRLDQWTATMMVRVDEDFLPWYFGYWNQQSLGLAAAWQDVKYRLAGTLTDPNTPSASDRLVQEIHEQFAARVLHPESAQLFLEQVTRQTVEIYLDDLRQSLADVQACYQIPQPRWDRYLDDIAVTTRRIEGNREVPLTLKAATATSVGGGVVLARGLARLTTRLETRLGARAAEKTIAGVAGKTGAKVAAKGGGRLLGPAVTVSVIAWDLYDHHATVRDNKPVLRDGLAEYLALLKDSLLQDQQTGVAAAVHEIEAGIVRSLASRPGHSGQETLAVAESAP